MTGTVHAPTSESGVCACGWRSTASSVARADTGLQRHIDAAARGDLAAALPRSGSFLERFVDALFKMQSLGWLILRSLVIDVFLAVLITAPARQLISGWLFATTAVLAVMVSTRMLTVVAIGAGPALSAPHRRLFGAPIYSGVVGPDRDTWTRAIAGGDMMTLEGPRQFRPLIEEFARISVRELYPAWIGRQYDAARQSADGEPATIKGRSTEEILRADVLAYRDPVSGESVADLMRDPLRFERIRLMGVVLRSFVDLAGDLSYLAFVVLLAVAVPAVSGSVDGVTAIQLGLAAVFVIALLIQAYLWLALSNVWFEVSDEVLESVSPGGRRFLQELQGRRLRPRWSFKPGFDSLLRRTMSARLALPLLANGGWVLLLIGVSALLCLIWPGGPHRVPMAYGQLAVVVLVIPVALLLGLHFILGVIQNHRRVVIPVVSGVAAALLAGAMTVLSTGERAGLEDAIQGAWVGLPTALAAALVSALQRPA